jgi:dihydrofolate reductase
VVLTRNIAQTSIELEECMSGGIFTGIISRDLNHIPMLTDMNNEVVICGGGEVYQLAMEQADTLPIKRIYRTVVHTEISPDDAEDGSSLVYYPDAIDFGKYELMFNETHEADSRHEHSFTFQIWERKV